MSNLDFGCDRKAKNDFTASTYSVCSKKQAFSAMTFWEQDKEGNLVPYGDNSVSLQSHYDVFVEYSTSAWTQWYVFELKERNNANDFYTTAFINEEKWPQFVKYRDQGIIPCWCELYNDGTLRIWNLEHTDFCHLPVSSRMIKRINIDPYSPKSRQLRREIPMEDGTLLKRIDGNDEHGNN